MDGATSFGRWLRHRRRMLDLTQDELAQRVGCSVVTIRKIETDERRPSKQIAERLAASLDIPLAERPAFLQAARAELAAAGLDLGPPLADRAPPEAAPRPLPSGTVTFLFTDIEGSTQLWEQHPQAMPAALARHNAILQEAITAHGGVVFKTVGDAVHAVFGTAPAALAAALATQRALQAQAWGASGALHVRMALHTGLADERDGDYYGPPLNRAARLLAAGHGRQILLSGATQALVCDHLPPEMELRDLGTHRLKDLSRPEQIFQLVAPDLPADFPPLRSLDRHASNLPAQPTALIGREREVAAVCQLLRRADVRLLTLSGPGGVGKTRLVLQVAAEMLDEFAHGASFVALAPISDPGLVVSTIVQTLGLREVSGQPLLDMLKAYLHPKQRLLLLDNFEQLLAAAPLLADLLTACPQLKLLVTSRAVLHLSGEQAFPVPPLTLPELQQLPPAEADLVTSVSQYEAVRLFIARAQAVKPDFQVSTANAPAVAEICYRLDGLPLAIELAAAWVRLFPPQALLARLSSPLTLLTGGGRDLPERQQTLRQTLDWSYNLLDAGEQILFARLGVFAGGCTLEAAEAVCKWAGDLSVEVLEGLASLVDKSLLQQEEGRDGEPRFTMLETIREYAREQLERSGELDNVQQQHAAYYLALAEQAADRLAIEHDNFRAALQWGLERDADAGLHLAGTLPVYWQRRGDLTEGRSWLQALLDRVAALPELHGAAARRRQAAQAKALIGLSRTAVGQGDSAAGLAACEASVRLYRQLGDRRGLGFALAWLGFVAMNLGDMAVADRALAEAIALGRESGDTLTLAFALGVRSTVLLITRGDLKAARAECEESVRLARAAGSPWYIAQSLLGVARIAASMGQWDEARVRCREAVGLFRAMGDRQIVNMAHSQLAHMERGAGNLDAARHLYQQSIVVWQDLGQRAAIAHQLECFGFIARAQNELPRAARLFGAAEALREALGTPMTGLERTEYDREVAVLRVQMDAEAHAAKWAAGRAMTLDQAVAYALEGGN